MVVASRPQVEAEGRTDRSKQANGRFSIRRDSHQDPVSINILIDILTRHPGCLTTPGLCLTWPLPSRSNGGFRLSSTRLSEPPRLRAAALHPHVQRSLNYGEADPNRVYAYQELRRAGGPSARLATGSQTRKAQGSLGLSKVSMNDASVVRCRGYASNRLVLNRSGRSRESRSTSPRNAQYTSSTRVSRVILSIHERFARPATCSGCPRQSHPDASGPERTPVC